MSDLRLDLREALLGALALEASELDADGQIEDVTDARTTRWWSSDPAILRLDPSQPGIVFAGKDGGAIVSVIVGKSRATWSIDSRNGVLTHLNVPDFSGPKRLTTGLLARLLFTIDSSQPDSFDEQALVVTAHPDDAARIVHRPPYWYVQGMRPGPLTVRYVYGIASAESRFEIFDDVVRLTPIDVQDRGSLRPYHLWVGKQVEARVGLQSSKGMPIAADASVVWSSSAPEVLGVVQDGESIRMVGLASGEATLVAECLNARSTLEVVVCEEPTIEWF
ncbi:MAG: hypothetical protein K0S65_583 [Labilithrix sp.]|nr:hypothetical protein [Labilithrix sp.]